MPLGTPPTIATWRLGLTISHQATRFPLINTNPPFQVVSLIQGKEKQKDNYTGGTIFYDRASAAIFIANQVSLDASETLKSKHRFERWARSHHVAKIKRYRADNAPFQSNLWQLDFADKDQDITYSGVGAHHQHGAAERAIRTVTQWARTMLIHLVLHWPDQAHTDLWLFALAHAVYIWNNRPRQDSKIAPPKLMSKSKFANHFALQRLHVFGCPTYVPDPALQDGKKLPKWKPRSRRGVYLGYSPLHSSTVARILHPETGNVSPQYHYVYDDHFSTVPQVGTGHAPDPPFSDVIWHQLLTCGHENIAGDIFGEDDAAPPLQHEWLTPEEREHRVAGLRLPGGARPRESSPLEGGTGGVSLKNNTSSSINDSNSSNTSATEGAKPSAPKKTKYQRIRELEASAGDTLSAREGAETHENEVLSNQGSRRNLEGLPTDKVRQKALEIKSFE